MESILGDVDDVIDSPSALTPGSGSGENRVKFRLSSGLVKVGDSLWKGGRRGNMQ